MRQFQTEFTTEDDFSVWLKELSDIRQAAGMAACRGIFHIFTDSCQKERIRPVTALLSQHFPDLPYAGCTGNGCIIHGDSAAEHVVVTATFFEDPTTCCALLQLPVTHEVQADSAETFLRFVREHPWVRCVEMMTTIGNVNMPLFCSAISKMPEEIRLFGGGALATDVHDGTASETFVFSSLEEPSSESAVFILTGGPSLQVETCYVTGWRRLGLPFEVTACERNILKELDRKPAMNVYSHFLEVPKNEHFFDMAVVFPFCFEEKGTPYLRVSTNYLSDGSMVLGADIETGLRGNIAYGDPEHIVKGVNEALQDIRAFAPDAIRIFSCASRQFYWGDAVRMETLPFERLAPTAGFYTSGEFLRTTTNEHRILLHNVTMVIAALREGDLPETLPEPVHMEEAGFSRQIGINNCLTTFINAATDQLREANEKLSLMAITDGLTGLLNRSEIERRIRLSLDRWHQNEEGTCPPVTIMMDLDHFKQVNDSFGHQEGDEVLKKLAAIFQSETSSLSASVGRWGGEEFMFLIEGMDITEAGKLADLIRTRFSDWTSPVSGRHTISAGVAQATMSDTADTLTGRADQGLYLAKQHGRNRSVIVSIM